MSDNASRRGARGVSSVAHTTAVVCSGACFRATNSSVRKTSKVHISATTYVCNLPLFVRLPDWFSHVLSVPLFFAATIQLRAGQPSEHGEAGFAREGRDPGKGNVKELNMQEWEEEHVSQCDDRAWRVRHKHGRLTVFIR